MQPGTKYYQLLTEFQPPQKASLTEKIMTGSLASSLLVTLIHKIIRNRVWFMLQPCHVTLSSSSCVVQHLFAFQWGALAALAFPDLREHALIGETFNFFAEHILLLVVPIYMIYSGRYVVLPKSKAILFLSFFSYSFFHTPVLHTLSLTSGFNLNYMWTPPPIPLLLDLGPSYRIAMYGMAFLLKFITRFICVETILTFASRKQVTTNQIQKKKSKKIN
ncbi:unnamed protein product [Rhizopus stolonifer]